MLSKYGSNKSKRNPCFVWKFLYWSKEYCVELAQKKVLMRTKTADTKITVFWDVTPRTNTIMDNISLSEEPAPTIFYLTINWTTLYHTSECHKIYTSTRTLNLTECKLYIKIFAYCLQWSQANCTIRKYIVARAH